MTQDEINAYAEKFGAWAVNDEIMYVFTSEPVYTGWNSYPWCANARACRELRDDDGPSISEGTKIKILYNDSTGFTKISEGWFDFDDDSEIFSIAKELEPTLAPEEKRGMGVWEKIEEVDSGKTDSLELSGFYIPKHLVQLDRLKKLSLSACRVPAWIREISALKELSIVNCTVEEEVLPWISKMNNLEKLTISSEEGEVDLPLNLDGQTSLKELSLEYFELEDFPSSIGQLSSLRKFSLKYSECNIKDAIKILALLPELRELQLCSVSHIDGGGFALPDSISQLSKLEVLDMTDSVDINSLPDSIGELKNLRVLNICNCDHQFGIWADIKALPNSLCSLIHLEKLDIYGCEEITQLPENFESLCALKHLDICYTGIQQLTLTIEQIGHLECLRMQGPLPDLTKALNLKEFAWRKLPEKNCPENGTEAHLAKLLPRVPSVEVLYLMDGEYDDIDFIFDMPKLKEVHLFCRVRRMPDRDRRFKRGIQISR